jgi:hypothetical protein
MATSSKTKHAVVNRGILQRMPVLPAPTGAPFGVSSAEVPLSRGVNLTTQPDDFQNPPPHNKILVPPMIGTEVGSAEFTEDGTKAKPTVSVKVTLETHRSRKPRTERGR